MALNDTAKNTMLTHLSGLISHVSAHDDAPGTTGANELAGAPYARVGITWAAAATGTVSASNQPQLDIPAAATVAHIGLWSALTVGTFYGSDALATPEVYGSAGVFSVETADISLT